MLKIVTEGFGGVVPFTVNDEVEHALSDGCDDVEIDAVEHMLDDMVKIGIVPVTLGLWSKVG